MGEYAPRNPYHSPKFSLYVGQKYEYKRLLEFKVDKQETFQLEKGIVVSVATGTTLQGNTISNHTVGVLVDNGATLEQVAARLHMPPRRLRHAAPACHPGARGPAAHLAGGGHRPR